MSKLKTETIGGQALIEGIMMLGPTVGAVAVRTKDKSIYTEKWKLPPKSWVHKCPFVRGIFKFASQLKTGTKYLNLSMEKSGYLDDDEEDASKLEKRFAEKTGKSLLSLISVLGSVIGIALAIILFIFFPTWLFTFIQSLSNTDFSPFRSLFEGVIKIIIYIFYLWLTSLIKDIRRTYEYHGAEHKTIAAFEAGEALTVENVKKYKRFHPRCGTSFIFLVLAISILITSLVPINSEYFSIWLGVNKFVADLCRTVCKLLLLPVIVGISYEVIRLAGCYDNIITRIISAPGLAIQRLTTKEPDEEQLECAIAAVMPCIEKDISKDADNKTDDKDDE